jgi:transposase
MIAGKQNHAYVEGSFFKADTASDGRDARKMCCNHGLIPNIAENQCDCPQSTRERKCPTSAEIYKQCSVAEHTFAWVDHFQQSLIYFERQDDYFLGGHLIVFAMINLQPLTAA